MKIVNLLSAAIVSCGLAATANGSVIFSNLGSATPISANHAKGLSPVQYIAMPFSVAPGTGFELTQIDIGLLHSPFLGGTNSATVQLVLDSAGLPGSFIDSWVLSNLPDEGTATIQPSQTISGLHGTTLAGGMQYWLIAIASSTSMSWGFANPEIVGPFALSIDAGTNWTLSQGTGEGAFDVLGTPLATTSIPEPASALLLALGLAGMALPRMRRSITAA